MTPAARARTGIPAGRLAAPAVVLALIASGAISHGCGERRLEVHSQGTIAEEDLAGKRATAHEAEAPEAIRFGFDLRSSADEDAKQYLPFLRYLESATGSSFELVFTPGASSIVEQLVSGRVQLAAVGAGSFLAARARGEVTPLVRGVTLEGRAEYRSAIVTGPDSPIRELSQLRGKLFAFGDRTSTQGHLIPRIVLFQHGITASEFGGYEFTGSHRNVAEAVASGRADAGGMQDSLADELQESGLIRILYRSEYYPSSGIVAGPGLEPESREAIRRALLDFEPVGKHAEGLYNWSKTEMPGGFVASTDKDYDQLAYWARSLGLLQLEGAAE